MVISHPLSTSSIYYEPWHPPSSVYVPDFFSTISPSFLWSTSWPGTLNFILHTFLHSIIVFFSHQMPIPSNPSPCHNLLLGTLSCSLTPHIHVTILISACWSATSFSFLMGQGWLPCNTLLLTQLLYNLPLTINDISLWYQLPKFIPSNSDSVLHSCISISIYTQRVT